jgi:peptide/nickel transport system substrate-binding protein
VPIEADIPPASWAYNPDIEPVERDVAAATALIEESGWTRGADGVYANPDGRTLSTRVYVRAGRPDRIAFMQLLRDQVAECGIQIEVVEADFATILVPMLSFPHIPPDQATPFDAYFGGWSTSFDPDPYSLWHSSQCTTAEQPETFNYICYNNPRVDEIIEEGLATTDQEARAELYFEFQEILAEEQPYLFAWSDLAAEGLDVNLESTAGELDLSSPLWLWQLETLQVAAE